MHSSRFRKYIGNKLALPLQDFTNGTSIVKTLEFLRKSQHWDLEKMEEYRLLKLKKLIKFASENVPYYEKLFRKIKLNHHDIKQVSDVDKIPILTREIIIKENNNLLARNFNFSRVNKGKTGGTTGSPVIIYKDSNNRSFTWASYYRWYDWMGIEVGDKSASLWGSRNVLNKPLKAEIKDSVVSYIQNRLSINAFSLHEQNMPEIYNALRKFEPLILKGYVSSILQIAEYIKHNNLEVFYPKAISTTSEVLLPHVREYLENLFKVKVYDQYGCGELSAISYECSKHKGLHVNQEHIILEVLDDNNSSVINQIGRVVGTDLDNFVMPFIRYENGDLASLTTEKCTCGVNQPLMHSIEGRSADTITLKNGSAVHGVFLTDILYELNLFADKIQKFQAIQHAPGQICLLLESNESLNNTLLETLKVHLNPFFDDIQIENRKKLESEPNGKFKYIKILRE